VSRSTADTDDHAHRARHAHHADHGDHAHHLDLPRDVVLLERQVQLINRFPDQNPNPVLRMRPDGHLLYANSASQPILDVLGTQLGDHLPSETLEAFKAAAADPGHPAVEIQTADWRTFAVWAVSVPEFEFINLYGTDITAAKVIDKFPAANPNPVIRMSDDRRLVYANRASQTLIAGLECAVGDPFPDELADRIQAAADGAADTIEVHSQGYIYELTPVRVPEFGFINIYGTDVTAARAIAQANAENEALLLNILPAPIAERLRRGERIIADRFEEITLLFADIVGFTQLSSRMSPTELVGVLNEVFSLFDELVDRHGLEKIKTIGDAYMVVGGLPPSEKRHTHRVAEMALDLAADVALLPAAVSTGIEFRIGIHVGPAVAGVIGRRKFIYDVWGDTVNTASRMEAHGLPGRIHVTRDVRDRLRGRFTFEPRGLVDVRGKGPMPTYFLLGRGAGRARKTGSGRSLAGSAG
jgi:class 3 adenylate cyclase